MARINFANGSNSYWFNADETETAIIFAHDNGISFEAIAAVMDDEIREEVAFEITPCSDEEFLGAYLKRADADLIIG